MEDTGILTPDNDVDLFCLHFVYTPLNKALKTFKRSWNNHKLSSEGNATPQQLYIRGILQRFGTDDPAVRDVIDGESIDENQFGVDSNGPTPENRSNNDVQVQEATWKREFARWSLVQIMAFPFTWQQKISLTQ